MGLIALVLFIIGLAYKKESPKRAKTLIGIALGCNIVGLFRIVVTTASGGTSFGMVNVFVALVIIVMTIIMGVVLSKMADKENVPEERKDISDTTKDEDKKGEDENGDFDDEF